MKNIIVKITMLMILVVGSLNGESMFENTYSLVGIEGGYGSLDVEKNTLSSPAVINKYNMAHGGLKIGAQSKNYRVFLSARYYDADDFDYVTTYGAELQYLINMSSAVNFYIGANAGIANIKYLPEGETNTRTASNSYMGGDVGVNVHLNEAVDLELGARIHMLDISNTIDSVKYTFDTMISGYVGVIYKFQMD